MTKKNYVVIANELGAQLRRIRNGYYMAPERDTIQGNENVFWSIVNALSDVFRHDNPKYSEAKFLDKVEQVGSNPEL